NHQHRLIRLQLKRFDGFHAGIYRLDKRSLLIRNTVGNPHHALAHDPIHHPDILSKAPAARLKTRRCAYLFIDWTLSKNFFATVITLTAGNVMEHHHAVADGKILYSCAYCHNLASHLM